MKITGQTIFAAGFGLAVLAAVIAGVVVVGPPGEARRQQLDKQRVRELQALSRALADYHKERGDLPASLDQLADPVKRPALHLADPETKIAYEFRATAPEAYELCAAFQATLDAATGDDVYNAFWYHPPGRACYQFTVPPPKAKK
jgi:hypothetical protein